MRVYREKETTDSSCDLLQNTQSIKGGKGEGEGKGRVRYRNVFECEENGTLDALSSVRKKGDRRKKREGGEERRRWGFPLSQKKDGSAMDKKATSCVSLSAYDLFRHRTRRSRHIEPDPVDLPRRGTVCLQ